MSASNFKTVLHQAGLTPEQFAEIVDVDPKTVRRWNNGRLPYPRHRAKIARALDTTEQHLWPDATPEPADTPEPNHHTESPATEHPAAALPPDVSAVICEVTASWGSPRDPGAPNVPTFLSGASQTVDVLPSGSGLLRSPGLSDAVKRCASAGARVRLLVETLRDVADLADHPRVEVRVIDQRLMHGVIRGDDRLLLGLRLAGDAPVPLLRVERQVDGGVFDRLTGHFDVIWEAAQLYPDAASATGASASTAGEGEPGSARHWPRRSD